jgi:hypothetical protein
MGPFRTERAVWAEAPQALRRGRARCARAARGAARGGMLGGAGAACGGGHRMTPRAPLARRSLGSSARPGAWATPRGFQRLQCQPHLRNHQWNHFRCRSAPPPSAPCEPPRALRAAAALWAARRPRERPLPRRENPVLSVGEARAQARALGFRGGAQGTEERKAERGRGGSARALVEAEQRPDHVSPLLRRRARRAYSATAPASDGFAALVLRVPPTLPCLRPALWPLSPAPRAVAGRAGEAGNGADRTRRRRGRAGGQRRQREWR